MRESIDNKTPGVALPRHSHQVALVVLPDQFDLSRWFQVCNEAGRRAQYAGANTHGPFDWISAETTYPQMRYLSGVSYIYLGWRGQLHFRHRATQTRKLRPTDFIPVGRYFPGWRERYRSGEWYHWGSAVLKPVPHYPLPSDITQSPGWNVWRPIWGTISDLASTNENPTWLGMGYEAMYHREQGLP